MHRLTMSKLNAIADGQIATVLANAGLTVILMTAPWDGNGIIMSSILKGFVSRYRNVSFCVADYEDSPRLTRLFNLTAPPGIIFVKDGEMVERLTGPVNASRLNELLQVAA
jgi:thioredoxin-like negative regulator of GroEL